MPLPLIAAGALLTGAYGAYKSGKAIIDSSEADDINNSAERIIERTKANVEEYRNNCNDILSAFGKKKVDAITININKFAEVFGQLKNVELSNSVDLGQLEIPPFDAQKLYEMKNEVSMLEASGLGVGSGAAGGALTAFGAYNGAMMLASASTGTAISSLSGAAATNATLAWFGGGSLGAGGLGMAGGTMILGGLVAGPALAILGGVMGAKAEKKLNDAKSNRELALAFESDSQIIITKLIGITDLTSVGMEALSSLRTALRRSVKKLEKVIKVNGVDYSNYSDSDKELVFKTVMLAQLVKALIDTAILDEEGSLIEASKQKFVEIENQI